MKIHVVSSHIAVLGNLMTRGDPFDGIVGERRRAREHAARFPTGVAIMGIVGTGLAFTFSVVGVRWGAALVEGDALRLSWLYVSLAMIAVWLVGWPAIAMSRSVNSRPALAWDFLALLLVSAPTMGVAAVLSGVDWRGIGLMAATQGAIGLFALGTMALRGRIPAGVVAGLLAALGIVAPVMGYVWTEFFPAAGRAWLIPLPVDFAARTARGEIRPEFWWIVGGYIGVGVVLFALGTLMPANGKHAD